MSHSVTTARIARQLPLYGALLECGFRDGPRLHPGTSAAIWHRIDSLRAVDGSADEIRVLEGIAVEVHCLKERLRALADDADGDLAPRARIAALTREWLAYAPLQG